MIPEDGNFMARMKCRVEKARIERKSWYEKE